MRALVAALILLVAWSGPSSCREMRLLLSDYASGSSTADAIVEGAGSASLVIGTAAGSGAADYGNEAMAYSGAESFVDLEGDYQAQDLYAESDTYTAIDETVTPIGGAFIDTYAEAEGEDYVSTNTASYVKIDEEETPTSSFGSSLAMGIADAFASTGEAESDISGGGSLFTSFEDGNGYSASGAAGQGTTGGFAEGDDAESKSDLKFIINVDAGAESGEFEDFGDGTAVINIFGGTDTEGEETDSSTALDGATMVYATGDRTEAGVMGEGEA